jgi:DNA-binding HxlR family transcriptional regulator
LLIVRDLAAGPRRFVELQRVLPGISTEQLRSRLNRMVADGLLTRERYREVPPRVDYELTDRAAELMPILGALARWGHDWAWSPPRPAEEVDIGAILRLAPGLLSPPSRLSGTLEAEVTERSKGSPERTYVLRAQRGDVTVSEEPVSSSDARVTGTEAAWIAALGPDADRSRLDITGDAGLAESLLEGLEVVPRPVSAVA